MVLIVGILYKCLIQTVNEMSAIFKPGERQRKICLTKISKGHCLHPKNLSLAFFFTSKSSALILSLCSLCLQQLQLQVAALCRTFSPGNFFSEQRYLPFCGRIHFTIALGGDICQQI